MRQAHRQFRTTRFRSAAAIPVLMQFFLFCSLLCLGACSKEDPKTKSSSAAGSSAPAASVEGSAARQAAAFDLTKSILELVPKDTLGFLMFEAKHPAYVRYKNSPWGNSSGNSNWSGMIQSANPELKQVAEMLKRLGFDLEDKDSFAKVFSECAVFVAPPVSAGEKPAAGMVFRPQPDFKVAEFIAKLKGEVTANAPALRVKELTIAGSPGVRLEDSADGGAAANPYKEFFLAQKDNVGVVATSLKTAENVLAAAAGSLPDLVKAPNYQRSSAGMPSNDSRFATLYVDLEKFASLADRFGQPELAKKVQSAPLPVKAISVALAMNEAPSTDVRLIYDDSTPENKAWLSTLGSSPSAGILAAMPSKPLFFLSVDGQTIQKAKEKALASIGPQAAEYQRELALLDGIGRLGMAAKSAPPGQSMLPLPSFLIVAEAKEPAKVQAAVERVLGPLASAGVPGMQWKTSDVGGVSVRSMQSPMGVGAFIAGTKNLVVLTSTDGEMKEVLANLAGKGGGFATGLSTNVEQVLVNQPSVGNLYVNFDEVASALEGVGGMLAMFAPQGQDSAQQFLSPENIQALRKMGTVVGAITLDAGAINIRSFYQGGQA